MGFRVDMLDRLLTWTVNGHLCNKILYHTKVCSEKKFTHILRYYANSVGFCGKLYRWAKSRHSEVSKMVRQVYIAQKMPSVDMILYFETFCESTIFVKKKNFKF